MSNFESPDDGMWDPQNRPDPPSEPARPASEPMRPDFNPVNPGPPPQWQDPNVAPPPQWQDPSSGPPPQQIPPQHLPPHQYPPQDLPPSRPMTPVQGYQGPHPGPHSNSPADIAAIVSGCGLGAMIVLSCFFPPLGFLGLVACVVGLVLGIKARKEAEAIGNYHDKQRATIAVVVGGIGVGLGVLGLMFLTFILLILGTAG